MEFGWHPHSGIATVTVMLEGAVRFAETTGREGVLPAGGVEWMRAGNSVWHTGAPENGRVRAVQLWVALPPALENAANESNYVLPQDVPVEGPARVILGSYGKEKSPINSPPMSYLHVRLQTGERWTYSPPRGHTVAWVAVSEGVLRAPSPIPSGEIAIFEPSEEPIDFVAEGATQFVLGSAEKHPHEFHLGNYSVHTSAEAPAPRRGGAPPHRQDAPRQRNAAALTFLGAAGVEPAPGGAKSSAESPRYLVAVRNDSESLSRRVPCRPVLSQHIPQASATYVQHGGGRTLTLMGAHAAPPSRSFRQREEGMYLGPCAGLGAAMATALGASTMVTPSAVRATDST
jgi:redox-sensitive bicupin YhaK (pirin superfamily)